MLQVLEVTEHPDGPGGVPYPAAVVQLDNGRQYNAHRRCGSWMIDRDAGWMRELPFDVADALQSHADVRRIDRARRAAVEQKRAAAPEPEPDPEWAAGDRVMWNGLKARVLGPSREEGRVRVKCQKRVHHVAPTSLTERSARR